MEHYVDAFHHLVHQARIPDVAFHYCQVTARGGLLQIVAPAPAEIVENHDLGQMLLLS